MTPILTREQVRRLDDLAIHRYGIAGLVLMENAGRNAAAVIDAAYGAAGRAFVCCGPGNNGGDGCVIARHLHNAGWSVRGMITGDESRMTPDTLVNYGIVKAMGLELPVAADRESQQRAVQSIQANEVVIDAVLGTGFTGQVRSPITELLNELNQAAKRAMIAIDVPSGLNCDRGTPGGVAIRAELTVTFVARKVGFDSPSAAPYLGRVEVVDIGAPRELLADVIASSGLRNRER